MRLTRRQMLRAGALAGAGAAIGIPEFLASRGARAAQIDPTTIPQFVTPLFVLPAMPISGSKPQQYSVAARPFTQQVLPSGYPATPVFGFGSTTDARTFHAPGYTIEGTAGRPIEVTWANQLVDASNNYVPSLLPIDPTLHWANPPGGQGSTDITPNFTSTPSAYTGPLPLVVHLHGSHDYEESDGYPEAWTLPNAANIPSGYATGGSYYSRFKQEYAAKYGTVWAPGTSRYHYDNDQRATQLWYHDHSLGMTRTSIRSGLAGMYILRGGPADFGPLQLPGPAPQPGDPAGKKYYEIPLVFQDPTFNTDGTQFLPPVNIFAPATNGYIPSTDLQPIWNAVFFGNTITVNGNTWPYLNVEPRRYRFRLLNSASVRTLVLKIAASATATRPVSPSLPIWVIGSDGGLLPNAVNLQSGGLQIQPSERYDVIVDFTGLAPGTTMYLINEGPAATVGTTGSVMEFKVVPLASVDTSIPPAHLAFPRFQTIGTPTNTRKVSFNEQPSTFAPGTTIHYLGGTVNADGTANPLLWSDPVTEKPAVGTTEEWQVYNFTPVGHVFHVHLVQFQVIGRMPIGGGTLTPPASYEIGNKDSVTTPNGQITRIKATFDHRSRYIWHCHFLDHEDNEMMRPYDVV